MTALAGQKRYLTFKGVGKGVFNALSDGSRIFDVIKATDIKFAWEVKTKDLVGGDSIWPFGQMVTEATGSVAITEGTLDMNVFQAQNGTAPEYGVATTFLEIDERQTIPATSAYTVTLEYAATITADVPLVRFLDGTGTLAKVTEAPATGEYSIAAGVLTFAAADAGKQLTIDYHRTIASADIASAVASPAITYGTYYHTVKYMNPITGVEGLGQLVIYRCTYNGKNELGFKRGDAATPAINLSVYDPGRADGKVFDLKRIS